MDHSAEIQRTRRLLSLTWLLFGLVLILFVWPTLKLWLGFGVTGKPRSVTARGELADFERTTTELFREASPSVVYINTRARVRSPWSQQAFDIEAGTGTGFMWDEAGHVVTNFHVIENATSAQVVFYDQTALEATLVGTSSVHDLAVLRIQAPTTALRPILLGTSRDVLVGQSVFAIGNPFGLSQTLTSGIVSARSRTIRGPGGQEIDDVIQIDAAINPGNSGGPLLDSAGRLIGVNTAIYSLSGTSAGVGFAIPADTVNRIVPSLIAKGNYRRPQLGIRVSDELSRALMQRLGQTGVVVMDVQPGSGAAEAGLRGTDLGNEVVGDIIQSLGGQTIANLDDLYDALEDHSPGDSVPVGIFRNGQRRTVDVILQ